jgi:hypothetical protein
LDVRAGRGFDLREESAKITDDVGALEIYGEALEGVFAFAPCTATLLRDKFLT